MTRLSNNIALVVLLHLAAFNVSAGEVACVCVVRWTYFRQQKYQTEQFEFWHDVRRD